MNQKGRFLEHYFRMYEMSEFDGVHRLLKDETNEFNRQMMLANIPANYYKYELKDVLETWSNDVANDDAIQIFNLYYENLEKAQLNGTGLYFTGTHGLAKTTAAVVILKKAIEQKFTCYFLSMNDLVDFVTSGWKDYNLKLKYQYIVTNADFLVLDDLGRNYHVQSSQSTQFLDKLFVTRCNQKKSTIITSMHGISSESTIFTESLLSLLKSNLIEIKLVGHDIREDKSKSLIEQLSEKNTEKSKGRVGKKGHNG
ncbi:MAG: ATP-binding protein [Nitrosarchaeum sp.]|nr:ATP-binding protein [Nitrosarchaeum sp.]